MSVRIGRLVTVAEGIHPFPSRTRSLSPPAPTILRGKPRGTIGRCRPPRLRSQRSSSASVALRALLVDASGQPTQLQTLSAHMAQTAHVAHTVAECLYASGGW